MRLESLTLRGFMTAFAGKQVSINFSAMPDGLIALVADNGQGKTTLLDAAPAGIYRQMMSRNGDLKTYAMDRDSEIASSWRLNDDTWYQARLTIDGIKGGASAALHVSDTAGVRPLNDGKVSTYDLAVAKAFPPLHVFKASAFAAQNKSGSFVKASKKERRDIFASFLGLDRLIEMSDTAKAAAAEVEKVRVWLKADVDVLERETTSEILDGLRRQIAGLEVAEMHAGRRKELLATSIADAEQRLALLSDSTAAHAAAAGKVTHLAEVLRTKQRELDQHVADDLVATLAESNEASGNDAAHAARQTAFGARCDSALAAERHELQQLTEQLKAKLTKIEQAITNNGKVQAQREEILAAVAAIKTLMPEIQQLRARREVLLEQQQALTKQQAENEKAIAGFTKPKSDLERTKADAALLDHVPCGGRGEFAGCQLLVNAKTAESRIADLEAQLVGMTEANETRVALADQVRENARELVSVKTDLTDAEQRLQSAQDAAKYADALAASDARIAELKEQCADAEHETVLRQQDAGERHAIAAAARSTEQLAIDRELVDAKNALAVRVDARLQATRAKQVVLTAAVSEATAHHGTALDELHALADSHQVAAGLQADLQQLRADRDAAVTAIATAASDAAAVRQRLEDLDAKAQRLATLKTRLAVLDTELLEWQLLQKALGREGLTDLEIDQAGPAISAIANEILADCFESRFSIELVTQVAKADGKEMKAEFTVLVTDNQAGDTRDISDLSGGEEVIVAEALMNAIAIFVNERSTTPMRTCFRDETTGALSKENTQRYVQMLRKVQAIGGFKQIIFISHDPDAYALADAQIHVANGTATPKLPPYVQEAA